MTLVSPNARFAPEVPHLSIMDYLLQHVQKTLDLHGDKIWMKDVSTGETILYSEIELISRRVGSALVRRGFQSQDTAIYVTRNTCELYAFFIGVWRINGIIRPSFPDDTAENFLMRMEESRCKFVLCDKETAPKLLDACKKLAWSVQLICIGDQIDGCTSLDHIKNDDGSAFPEKVLVDPDEDLMAVMATGGTTGLSKGAAVTHKAMISYFVLEHWLYPRVPNGIVLAAIRMFHQVGHIFPTIIIVYGYTLLTMSQLTMENLRQAIQEYKPGGLFAFSSMLLSVCQPEAKNYDLSSVITLATGGGPIKVVHQEALKKALPNLKHVHRGYGLTETNLISLTVNGLSKDSSIFEGAPPKSVGYLLPSVKAKFVDLETGEILGVNKPGEIWVKSPMLMKCYLNNKEATSQTMPDGWMRTGDFGYYDENGFIFVTDRLKDVFKHSHYHVSPMELEQLIMQIPSVFEVCVIGVPDEQGVEMVARAFVVKKEGHLMTKEEIKSYVHDRVAFYKQLKGGVTFIDEMPKTATGKISRQQLIELYVETKTADFFLEVAPVNYA